MWATMFIMLFVFAVIMMLLSIFKDDNPFWNLTGAFISSVTWLYLALSQMVIEIPYTFIKSDDTILTGTHTFTSGISPYLVYFFWGLFVIMQIYVWVMVFDKMYSKEWANPSG